MCGRLAWASGSDYLGRKNTYTAFFTLGPALYLSVPVIAGHVGGDSYAPLLLFCGATGVIFTMYGGGFATIPAKQGPPPRGGQARCSPASHVAAFWRQLVALEAPQPPL